MNRLLQYFKGDPVIWGMLAILSAASILVVYSATGTLAYSKFHGETFYFLFKQTGFVLAGVVVAFLVHMIDIRLIQKFSFVALVASIGLLVLTMLLGPMRNDAARWLSIGGVTFQTSDFAKVALIMFVAHMLATHQNDIKELHVFAKIISAIGVVCVIILPNNFSTAAMLGFVCVTLLFIGRISVKHLGLSALLAVGMLVLFIVVAKTTGFQEHRITTWEKRIGVFSGSSEQKHSKDDTFQADQSKIAVATGGLFGKGPGNSTQRNYLPHPYSDFIFAIIIEEYGLLGGLVIMIVYLALLFRAGVIVKRSDKTYPAFLTMGLVLLLVVQAMINMGVAVGIFPVTGQTLPFVSMGGSSILITGAVFGLIQSANCRISESKSGKKATKGETPNQEKDTKEEEDE